MVREQLISFSIQPNFTEVLQTKARHDHSVWLAEKIDSSSSRNNIVFDDLVKEKEMSIWTNENRRHTSRKILTVHDAKGGVSSIDFV